MECLTELVITPRHTGQTAWIGWLSFQFTHVLKCGLPKGCLYKHLPSGSNICAEEGLKMTTGAAAGHGSDPETNPLFGLEPPEDLKRNEPEIEQPASKFQPCQVVKIRVPREGENPGSPVPTEAALGMTGVVEMEGRVYVSDDGENGRLEQAYFIRVDGIGPVLAGEDWLEDG